VYLEKAGRGSERLVGWRCLGCDGVRLRGCEVGVDFFVGEELCGLSGPKWRVEKVKVFDQVEGRD
jgi:hypothetical protein